MTGCPKFVSPVHPPLPTPGSSAPRTNTNLVREFPIHHKYMRVSASLTVTNILPYIIDRVGASEDSVQAVS